MTQIASEAQAAAACMSKSYMTFEPGNNIRDLKPKAIPISVPSLTCLSHIISISCQELEKVKKAFAAPPQGADDGSGDEGAPKHSKFNQKEKRKRDIGQSSRLCMA